MRMSALCVACVVSVFGQALRGDVTGIGSSHVDGLVVANAHDGLTTSVVDSWNSSPTGGAQGYGHADALQGDADAYLQAQSLAIRAFGKATAKSEVIEEVAEISWAGGGLETADAKTDGAYSRGDVSIAVNPAHFVKFELKADTSVHLVSGALLYAYLGSDGAEASYHGGEWTIRPVTGPVYTWPTLNYSLQKSFLLPPVVMIESGVTYEQKVDAPGEEASGDAEALLEIQKN